MSVMLSSDYNYYDSNGNIISTVQFLTTGANVTVTFGSLIPNVLYVNISGPMPIAPNGGYTINIAIFGDAANLWSIVMPNAGNGPTLLGATATSNITIAQSSGNGTGLFSAVFLQCQVNGSFNTLQFNVDRKSVV